MENAMELHDRRELFMSAAEKSDPPPFPDARGPRGGGEDTLRVALLAADAETRHTLSELLDAIAGVEIVGAGLTVNDASTLAQALSPHVLFVAHDPPYANGIEAIKSIRADARPAVIVVARSEEYAFQAFEVGAVDYLVRPVTEQRLTRALARACRLTPDAATRRLQALAAELAPSRPRSKRFVLKMPGHLVFLHLHEIDWIEAAGNYVRIHTARETLTTREALARVEQRLDRRFVRVHRSAIVNTDRIKRISTDELGRPTIELHDGTTIPGGRYLDGQLREWMDSAL